MGQYLLYNNHQFASNEKVLCADNRAFCYGDGVFETLKMEGNSIFAFDLHWQRLQLGMQALNLNCSYLLDKETLLQACLLLCNANQLSNARIRLQVFRKSGDFYASTSKDADYILQAFPLEPVPEKVLKIDICESSVITKDSLSNLKLMACTRYVVAAQEMLHKNLDELIILNSNGNVCESISGNVFIKKNELFYTPPLSEACIAGVMRQYFINQNPEKVIEKIILPQELLAADEIWLSNVIKGFRKATFKQLH